MHDGYVSFKQIAVSKRENKIRFLISKISNSHIRACYLFQRIKVL